MLDARTRPASLWGKGRSLVRSALVVTAVNAAVLLALLVPIELIFGNWIRPMRLGDLKRFAIPVGVSYEFDTSSLYGGGPRNPIHYTRDQWGLRGSHRSLEEVEVVTIGGSTTDQRYLDDQATWQTVAQRESERAGRPLVFANAGVDGQSTVGHAFTLQNWFPLLDGLKPRIVLFYVGINDVINSDIRGGFDTKVDASSWRVRSATYQLFRLVRGNVLAKNAGVTHGRMRPLSPSDFTEKGLLSAADRDAVRRRAAAAFVSRVGGLAETIRARGATPVFVTQTAFAWNADQSSPARGVKEELTARLHGYRMNFADVAFMHQAMNRDLLASCAASGMVCFDLASDVTFGVADYYDFTHNSPAGAEKIGRYIARRLGELERRAQR